MYSNNLICDILEYINNNVNSYISINDLSNRTFFNRYYIMKLFKKEIGISINEYINIKRIYNSINQIRNSNSSFLKIALDNGFNSLEYFSETFKKVMGVNPSTFKKTNSFIVNISERDLNTIKNNLIKIEMIINNTDIYLSRRKPSLQKEKKLSIFKKRDI